MPTLISIDPGDELSALAILKGKSGHSDPSLVLGVRIKTAMLIDWLETWAKKEPKPIIAYEEFLLYPDYVNQTTGQKKFYSKAQRFSEMKTPKTIGIIEFTIERYSLQSHHCRKIDWSQRWPDRLIQKMGYWGEYNATESRHIRDATGIGLYFWYTEGIFNNNERCIGPKFKKVLID